MPVDAGLAGLADRAGRVDPVVRVAIVVPADVAAAAEDVPEAAVVVDRRVAAETAKLLDRVIIKS
jgi:hypothetical protein